MQYLALVYMDEAIFDGFTAEQFKQLDRESLDYDAELLASQKLLRASALEQPTKAVTLRLRHGALSASDGPFAETKEHLGGFLLLDAADFNEALRLAGGIPLLRYGASVEVRPIMDLSQK